MPTFYIQGTDVAERLDRYLTDKLVTLSRNQIQKLIERGRITLNGRRAKPHTILQKKDHLEVQLESERVISQPIHPARGGASQLAPPLAGQAGGVTVQVLAEDVNFLVINKPANLLTHPVPGRPDYTLVDWMKGHDSGVTYVSEDPSRPGIVHRLDEGVSGVMVIAKTQAAFLHLKDQFVRRGVEKEYTALVHGKMEQPNGTIDFPIARSQRHGRRMAARPHSQGADAREAVTRYTVREEFQHYTLLTVVPETGRTNQIRVHLNAINHPVVGDPIYRPRNLKATKTPGRIFLQSVKLSFHDLTGQPRTYEAALDPTLQDFLDQLRGVKPAVPKTLPSTPKSKQAETAAPAAEGEKVDILNFSPYDDLALYEFTHAPSDQPAEAADRPADDSAGHDRPRPPEDQGRGKGTHSDLRGDHPRRARRPRAFRDHDRPEGKRGRGRGEDLPAPLAGHREDRTREAGEGPSREAVLSPRVQEAVEGEGDQGVGISRPGGGIGIHTRLRA